MKTYEFGASLENLQTHSKFTKKSLLDVIFQKKCFFQKRWKNEFGESPNSLQTQKNMRPQFFSKQICVQPLKKKLCTHIFLSLERFWRFSKLIFPFFVFVLEKWHQANISSYVFSVFRYFIVSLEKRNEFGVSLEILQTLPKLAPSSYFLYISSFFGGKEEWVWSEFGDFPNSLQTHF